ncbi:MAG: tRNA (guanosine(37)-N1)-methyltransferase TrmD [Desulfobacterales bacterium]|jgi:tRNA (guanine37-N1)-methyltransferase|nr:tRNA (guanosine(37)-N1)-methyltransferase TrmD [Desulfobacterales bacterium]
MRILVLTIFPDMFDGLWSHGMVRRAIEQQAIAAAALNIRDFAGDRHHVTDDRPYGGGDGMVMKPGPLAASIRHARQLAPEARTILMTPQGRVFNQALARELAGLKGLILVCGRYEGVDDRLCHELISDELSIGDYVLTGGEIAAMAVIDAVTRLIPGVLGGEDSAARDSFSDGLLEHAHYTRPPVFEGVEVPGVLLSGHHGDIERWRLESSLMRTLVHRPDLLRGRALTAEETEILRRWHAHLGELIGGRADAPGRKRR